MQVNASRLDAGRRPLPGPDRDPAIIGLWPRRKPVGHDVPSSAEHRRERQFRPTLPPPCWNKPLMAPEPPSFPNSEPFDTQFGPCTKTNPRHVFPSVPTSLHMKDQEPSVLSSLRNPDRGLRGRPQTVRAPGTSNSYPDMNHTPPPDLKRRAADNLPPNKASRYRRASHDINPRRTSVRANANQTERPRNLPQAETKKLRAWFMLHLQHPYPTEQEKQELVRETGLHLSASSSFQLQNGFVRRVAVPSIVNKLTDAWHSANLQLVCQRKAASPTGNHGPLTSRAGFECRPGNGRYIRDCPSPLTSKRANSICAENPWRAGGSCKKTSRYRTGP